MPKGIHTQRGGYSESAPAGIAKTRWKRKYPPLVALVVARRVPRGCGCGEAVGVARMIFGCGCCEDDFRRQGLSLNRQDQDEAQGAGRND